MISYYSIMLCNSSLYCMRVHFYVLYAHDVHVCILVRVQRNVCLCIKQEHTSCLFVTGAINYLDDACRSSYPRHI